MQGLYTAVKAKARFQSHCSSSSNVSRDLRKWKQNNCKLAARNDVSDLIYSINIRHTIISAESLLYVVANRQVYTKHTDKSRKKIRQSISDEGTKWLLKISATGVKFGKNTWWLRQESIINVQLFLWAGRYSADKPVRHVNSRAHTPQLHGWLCIATQTPLLTNSRQPGDKLADKR